MVNLKPKTLSSEITKIVDNNFNVVTDDNDFSEILQNSNLNWNDLIILKNEIGEKIMEFIGNITSLITNAEIINNLGSNKEHFNKLVSLFFTDINEFSFRVKELIVQHENKEGPVTTLDDYDLYNRLSIQYHTAFTELLSLTAPTLADIILIANNTRVNVPQGETHVQ